MFQLDDSEGRPETLIPLENDVYDLLERNGKLSQQLARLSHDLDLFYKKFKKMETTLKTNSYNPDSGASNDPVSVPASKRDSIFSASGGPSRHASTAIVPTSPDRKLASLHAEFVKTLGKIGGDLQETATRLKTFHEGGLM